jgi:hypothetical protein
MIFNLRLSSSLFFSIKEYTKIFISKTVWHKVYFMFDVDLILQYLNCVRNFVSFTINPWCTNQEKTEILTYMKHMLWNKNLLILTGKLRQYLFLYKTCDCGSSFHLIFKSLIKLLLSLISKKKQIRHNWKYLFFAKNREWANNFYSKTWSCMNDPLMHILF